MAWTQSDIDTIKAAIATGAKTVRYADGRMVEYRDLDHMLKTLQTMEDEVNPSSANERCTYASHRKD